VNSVNGNTATNGTVDAEGTVTAGAGNRIIIGTSDANDIDVTTDGTINTLDAFDTESSLTVGNANQFNVTNLGAVTTSSTIDANGTITAGASNMLIIGTDAATNDIDANDGVINSPDALALGGGISVGGNIDLNGNDIIDVDDLVFSQVTSDISNTAADVMINDNLIVTGTSDLRGAVFNSTGVLNLNDATQVTGTLDAQSSINNTTGNNGGVVHINDALTVVNATVLQSTLDAQGAINNTTGTNGGQVFVNDAFAVTGTSDLQGSINNTTGNNGGVVHVNDQLTVVGATVLQSTLDAQGAINNTTGTNGGQVFVNDNFAVVGTSDLQNTISNTTGNNGGQVFVGDNFAVTGGSDLQNSIVNTSGNNGGVVHVNDAFTVVGATVLQSTLDAQGSINNTTGSNGGAVHVNDAFTQVNGNVSMATTAGNTTTIGNTTGAMNLTGAPINLNTTGDLNTNIGNAAGANSTTTINAGTGGNLVLNGIDVDPTPTHWLTFDNVTNPNQVRQTDISGTADEGVSWDNVAGQYELGDETNTGVPFTENRFVNLNANDLTFTRNNGTETVMFMDGGAAGLVNLQTQSGALNLGNDASLNTINGHTLADGSGSGAFDLLTLSNITTGQDGIQVNAGQGVVNGIDVATTGTANGNAYNATVANTGALNRALTASVTGAGTNNTAIDLTVMGASNTNRGINIEVSGTNANGINIDANNTLNSNGVIISGAVNGSVVNLVPGVNGTAYSANLTANDNQTGFRVDMNGGGATATGLSISEIGSGTGAVIDMTGATGSTGLNILATGPNTGISVQSVTGAGIGISSVYTDNGAGTAVLARSNSSNPSSEGLRAQGIAGGAAAIDVTGGGIDATAGVGARFSDSHLVVAEVGTTNPVTIVNSVVRAGSTILLTYKNTTNGAATISELYITAQVDGQFDVQKLFMWDAGDTIEYMIINHGL